MLEKEYNDKKDCITSILEQCGRSCAESCGIDDVVHEIKKNIPPNSPIEEIIDLMNGMGLWDGTLSVTGNRITGYYHECCCPIRKAGYVSSPLFCQCTKGWTKAVFENIFNREVEVRLETTIASGGDACKITVIT